MENWSFQCCRISCSEITPGANALPLKSLKRIICRFRPPPICARASCAGKPCPLPKAAGLRRGRELGVSIALQGCSTTAAWIYGDGRCAQLSSPTLDVFIHCDHQMQGISHTFSAKQGSRAFYPSSKETHVALQAPPTSQGGYFEREPELWLTHLREKPVDKISHGEH